MQTNNPHAASTGVQGSPPTAGSSPPVVTGSQIEQRRASFMTWSSTDDGPLDFDNMAAAGWCNIGDGRVQSCCCGIVLEWKVNDDPWTQHAFLGSECSFLKQQKGQAALSMNGGGEPAEFEQPDVPMSPEDEAEIEKLREEIKFRKKEQNCLVCEDEARMVSFIPCGHFTCCRDCGSAQLKCPVCKEPIKNRILVYLS